MFAIQVPTWMRRVATPMSCAVAMTSLLTSAAKIASKPASSASRAIAWISLARQPTPGMTASPNRSAMGVSFLGSASALVAEVPALHLITGRGYGVGLGSQQLHTSAVRLGVGGQDPRHILWRTEKREPPASLR